MLIEPRKFDLNIEKILENWELQHAIRELIANAIDEEILTQTKSCVILKDKGSWHIRDYGRGLRYEHLTQKENEEKLANPHVIGKFGIGLKDALATLNRKRVKVLIRSKHGDITIGKSEKHGFEDLVTLHAYVEPPSESKFVGTEFILTDCPDDQVEKAKDLFLRFSGEKSIEVTTDGQVLKKKGKTARIYVNGVRVAEEENFLFSYNITSINKAIRRALNRERTNVGRTAYTERVKSILLGSKSKEIANELVKDLALFERGTTHDELGWIDVSVHACKLLNSLEKVIFLTPDDLLRAPGLVDKATRDGLRVVSIPLSIKLKIRGLEDGAGNPIRDLEQFQQEWNESFQFKFVSEKNLTAKEREIFRLTDDILKLVGGRPKNVKEIQVSETMRMDRTLFREAEGVWESLEGRIVIKRTCLRSLERYAGTLLHEVAHATSGAGDVSDPFEQELTAFLGRASEQNLDRA